MKINNLKSVLNYLTEELKDIPAREENIHYTTLYKLYRILDSGKLNGGTDYFITTNLSDIKGTTPELCTIRKRSISDKQRAGLSAGASGSVKFSLFTKRILSSVRGVKKEPIAEGPKFTSREIRNISNNFKKDYKLDIPIFVNDKSDLSGLDLNKIKIDEIEKSKFPEVIKAWNFVKEHNLDIKAIKPILSVNRLTSSYNKLIRNRESEERFLLPNGLPIDSKYLSIEIISKCTNLDEVFMVAGAKKFYDLIIKYQDCFIKNKNFEDLKNNLKEIFK